MRLELDNGNSSALWKLELDYFERLIIGKVLSFNLRAAINFASR